MKYLPLLLITCALSVTTFSQQKADFVLGLSYSTLNQINNDDLDIRYPSSINNAFGEYIYFNEYNFSIGLNAEYFLTKQLNLSSGAFYENRDYQRLGICPLVCDGVPQSVNSRYLSIPVQVNYLHPIIDSKIYVSGGIGIVSYFNMEKERTVQEKSFLNGNAKLGLRFNITEKVNITTSANYALGFTDRFTYSNYKDSFFAFQFGLNYTL